MRGCACRKPAVCDEIALEFFRIDAILIVGWAGRGAHHSRKLPVEIDQFARDLLALGRIAVK